MQMVDCLPYVPDDLRVRTQVPGAGAFPVTKQLAACQLL